MNVVFRADASVQIGTGHVMRCLTLAEALRRGGHQCQFICSGFPGHFGRQINEKGFAVETLPSSSRDTAFGFSEEDNAYAKWLGISWQEDASQTLRFCSGDEVDWIVVDHYALDARWERSVSNVVGKIMVIDDLANRPHFADILLDQNLGRLEGDYDRLVSANCKRLIGPEYALLRPEFSRLRKKSLERRYEPELKRILVSMGGTDTPNATAAVLTSLESSSLPSHLRLDVVMGAKAPWLNDIGNIAKNSRFNVTVSTNVQDMGERMCLADLSIGAAGSTSWERCALGLPSIVVSQAQNQSGILQALSGAGAAIKLDFPIDEAELASLVVDFYSNPEKLATMARNASLLCDGMGVQRVIGWLDDEQ
ncbi:UDP-2,4-diacetamido-2,4,6-trideoxy-beta-L-altropyranose hydrolase [Marinobacter salsuginis]|uniref:UDP-2,4-diacetamido-2,4, 6-trideoxy-beta-L-altropyranose hydrolase n=1 Tax=Marinobacter salsuginis TaxID=418719 RepID=UPI001C965F75|nr:UDP-2,4-diacetamido-2,4,6-trideoxy-beta-L-altropyranose hydrolase [Marinobacter salsuginis]MBY6070795.1 UDP-2,4-diacetamido-2,4,6-trideoxy-beta-L-altropyranose hydrolase [Marinobacter salsuginis]